MTVRLLATSCASREFMGGGAAPYLIASPIPRRVSARGMVKRRCVLNGLEKRGGGGGTRGDRGAGAGDGNNRQASAGGHAGRRGRPRVSRRKHTVVRRRLRGAAAPEGLSRGPATACRRPVACFTTKHRVPFWNIRPCFTLLPRWGRRDARLGNSGGDQIKSLHAEAHRRHDLPAQSRVVGHQPDDLAPFARPW